MFRNIIANLTLAILPTTRCFKLKQFILNKIGFRVSKSARICGGVKFYGRGQVSIGEDSFIGIGGKFITSPSAPITIGDRCDIAPFVIFHTGSHNIGDSQRRAGSGYSASIHIGNGTWVGTKAVILGGVTIGNSSILGAGSVALPGSYSENTLIAGIPATEKKNLANQKH